MAKVKKMFGGGMGSRMAAPRAPMGGMGGMGMRGRMAAKPAAPSQASMQAAARNAAPVKSGLTALDPAQFAAMQKAQAGSAPSAAADAGAAKAYADMQAQKSGATPAASQAAPMKKGGVTKMAKGGVAESKKMVGKEVAFMKKKGAPKSMIKHEMAEAGMKTKKYAKGGMVAPSKMGSVRTAAPSRDGIASKGKTKGTMVKMAGASKGMKSGGKC